MRNADSIAAALVLRGACHILVACILILLVQITQSCIQVDSYTTTGVCLLAGLILLHGRLNQLAAMLLGLWLDLLYGRFLGAGVVIFGIAFHTLEVYAVEEVQLRYRVVRIMLFFAGVSVGLGLLALC